MKPIQFSLLLVLILFSPLLSSSQDVSQDMKAVEEGLSANIQVIGAPKETFTIADRMEHYSVPGLSIAIVKDGAIHWAKAYGQAQPDIPASTETLFQAGSISKPLAALAALKLYEEGKLDLDTDVNTYLNGWQIPESEFTQEKKITLRHLLTHTGGTTVHGFPGYSQADTFPGITEVLMGEGNTDKIESYAIPGENWKYSGGGYTIMEKVVEDVSGMPLEKFMAREIFPKLDMQHSTYAQPLPPTFHAQASAAYKGDGSMYEGRWHNYPEQAAAGLWTTPSDLANYCMQIQEIYQGKAEGVLAPETVKEMLTKHQNNWGLGPGLNGDGDEFSFGHGGKNAGFTNNMIASVNKGYAVVLMTNADRGGSLMREIMRSISNHYGWELGIKTRMVELKKLKKKELKALVGKYVYEEKIPGVGDYYIHLKNEKGKLKFEDPNDGRKIVMEHLGDMKFMDLAEGEGMDFEKNEKGNYSSFKWNDRFRFDRVDE